MTTQEELDWARKVLEEAKRLEDEAHKRADEAQDNLHRAIGRRNEARRRLVAWEAAARAEDGLDGVRRLVRRVVSGKSGPWDAVKLAEVIMSMIGPGNRPAPADGEGEPEAGTVPEHIAQFLFKLLDDIDTLDDACKDNDSAFREQAYRIQRRRFEVADTDGYTVRFKTADSLRGPVERGEVADLGE